MREALGDLQLEARARVPEQGREHLVDLVGIGRAQRDRLEEFVREIADDGKLDPEVDLIADCIARRKLVGEQVHARSPPPKYPGQTRDLHDGSRSLSGMASNRSPQYAVFVLKSALLSHPRRSDHPATSSAAV